MVGFKGEESRKEQRNTLLKLADRKLRGDARIDFRHLVGSGKLSERAAEAQIARLEALPDRGDGHPSAVLRPEHIPVIRAERAAGRSLISLAEEYGVSDAAISAIATGRTWKEIPE